MSELHSEWTLEQLQANVGEVNESLIEARTTDRFTVSDIASGVDIHASENTHEDEAATAAHDKVFRMPTDPPQLATNQGEVNESLTEARTTDRFSVSDIASGVDIHASENTHEDEVATAAHDKVFRMPADPPQLATNQNEVNESLTEARTTDRFSVSDIASGVDIHASENTHEDEVATAAHDKVFRMPADPPQLATNQGEVNESLPEVRTTDRFTLSDTASGVDILASENSHEHEAATAATDKVFRMPTDPPQRATD